MSEQSAEKAHIFTLCPVCFGNRVVGHPNSTWRKCCDCDASWNMTKRLRTPPGFTDGGDQR